MLAQISDKVRKEDCQNKLLRVLASRFGSKRDYFDNRFQSLDLKTFDELFETALKVQTLAEFENEFEKVTNVILSSKTKELSEV